MVTTNFAKGVYFLSGIGLLFGGWYFAKPLLIGVRVSDLLKVNNPKSPLLTKSSSIDKWKKSWYEYRFANKGKDKDAWNLSDWNKELVISDKVSAPISFIEACEINSEARVSGKSDELYQQVLKWCTGSLKIKDLIRDIGKRILTDKDPKDIEEYGWKPLWKKYFDANKKQSNNPLNIEGWNGTSEKVVEDNEEMKKKFIDKCKALGDVEVKRTTDLIYQKVNIYCSANIKAEDVIRDFYPSKKLINLTKIKGINNGVAQEIWDKYLNDEKDPWNIIPKTGNKSTIPSNFWDKCNESRKQEIKASNEEAFKEVLNYCTVDQRDFAEYGE